MQVDASVVIITVGRDSLLRAVRSVFHQTHSGILQILIGVDAELFQPVVPLIEKLIQESPVNIFITPIHMGYSTSVRHGGVHTSHFGGSLRTALSFLAASQYVTYLDDDDWYEPNHIESLLKAIDGHPWAFTLSNYADSNTNAILGVDTIESVGPGRGVFQEKFGGFVRPSALMLDKIKLSHLLHLWSISPFPTGDGEDRLIFMQLLKYMDYGETRIPTVNCALDPHDGMHGERMKSLGLGNKTIEGKQQTTRQAG